MILVFAVFASGSIILLQQLKWHRRSGLARDDDAVLNTCRARSAVLPRGHEPLLRARRELPPANRFESRHCSRTRSIAQCPTWSPLALSVVAAEPPARLGARDRLEAGRAAARQRTVETAAERAAALLRYPLYAAPIRAGAAKGSSPRQTRGYEMRIRMRLTIGVVTSIVALIIASPAQAGTAADDQYAGVLGEQGGGGLAGEGAGALPFTGLDLVLVLGVGTGLAATGAGLRRVARDRS